MFRLVLTTGALSGMAMVLFAGAEVLVARRLTIDAYGTFAASIALAAPLCSLLCVGLPQLALKKLQGGHLSAEAARWHADSSEDGLLTAQIALAHASTLAGLAACFYFLTPTSYRFSVLSFAVLPATMAMRITARRVLTGLNSPREGLLADEVAPSVVFLASIQCDYWINGARLGPERYLGLLALANSIAVVTFIMRDWTRFRMLTTPRLSLKRAQEAYREALHYVPFVFAFIGARKLDVVILAAVGEPHSVAIYAAASRMAMPGLAVAAALNMLSVNELANAYRRRSSEQLHKALAKWSKISLLVTTPYYILVCSIPGDILSFVFGKNFINGGAVLIVFCIGGCLTVATGPLLTAFSVTHLSRELSSLTMIYLAVLSVGVLSLSPKFGAVGAACAVMLASLFYRVALRQRLLGHIRSWRFLPSDT